MYEAPTAKRARQTCALARWRADPHHMYVFRGHFSFRRSTPLRRPRHPTRPRDRDHQQSLSRGTGGTEGFGPPLGHHIVPDRGGRQHPSSDRSVGARWTVTGLADRQLSITTLLDGAKRPLLSRWRSGEAISLPVAYSLRWRPWQRGLGRSQRSRSPNAFLSITPRTNSGNLRPYSMTRWRVCRMRSND